MSAAKLIRKNNSSDSNNIRAESEKSVSDVSPILPVLTNGKFSADSTDFDKLEIKSPIKHEEIKEVDDDEEDASPWDLFIGS